MTAYARASPNKNYLTSPRTRHPRLRTPKPAYVVPPTDLYAHKTQEGEAAQEIPADLPKECRREPSLAPGPHLSGF